MMLAIVGASVPEVRISFDDFCDLHKRLYEDVIKDSKPNDDVVPTLHLLGKKSSSHAIPDVVEPSKKNWYVGVIIPALIMDNKTFYGALVISAWMAVRTKATMATIQVMPPSMDPDRVEVVIIQAFSKDAERLCMGYLERFDNKPPIVTEWKEQKESDKLASRFANFGKYCVAYP